MTAPNSPAAIHAVIVTYETGPSIVEVIARLKGEVDHLVVVDNSSTPKTLALVDACTADRPGWATLIANDVNNLARAQNRGVASALAAGAEAVLLLDHDTRLVAGSIAALRARLADEPPDSRLGLIACRVVEPGRAALLWVGKARWRAARQAFAGRAEVPDLLFAIAAGSLVLRRALEATSLAPGQWFDEAYGIDYVDVEFGLRLRARGWRLLALEAASVEHRIGERQAHQLGPVGFTATHHSAARRRTIWRNRARTWRRYGRAEPGWALADMAAALVDLARILAAEQQKGAKLGAAAKGLIEGLRSG